MKCMQTNFDGRSLFGFGDFAPFCLPSNLAKFSFQTMGYSPWGAKNLIDRNRLKKFMQVGMDVTCMQSNFGGRSLFGFGDFVPFCLPSNLVKIPFQTMGYSPWGSKNLIDRNRLKKFMQVGMDVTCMQSNFGGRSLFGFGDFAPFCLPSNLVKIPFRTMGYSPWGSKNRIGSKNSCK